MTNAVAYYRMSSGKQDKSIGEQRTEVEAYARRQSYQIIREYIDEAISGDETPKRAAFLRMREHAQNGEFEVILCWDQDRFGRLIPSRAGTGSCHSGMPGFGWRPLAKARSIGTTSLADLYTSFSKRQNMLISRTCPGTCSVDTWPATVGENGRVSRRSAIAWRIRGLFSTKTRRQSCGSCSTATQTGTHCAH
jgi:Resolvase, N terminal domain